MDLRKQYGTDPKIETEGVDVHLGGDAFVTIARAGGANVAYQRDMMRAYKGHKRAVQAETMPPEEAEAIMREVIASTIVLGWRGVELDGAALEFNKANVLRLFSELPEVFKIIQEEANRLSNFRAEGVSDAGKV